MTFGLYWRRGTTAGAWTALIAGGGLSGLGMAVQRGWASTVHPFLVVHGWDAAVRHALEAASAPFVPWIDWRVPDALWPVKFPINSGEIYFIAAATAVLLYIIVSLITCRKPFDMERMLHRDSREMKNCGKAASSFARRFMAQLVNITPDYTRGDRIVTWVVFCYSIIYKFIIAFVMAAIVSRVRHWGAEQWGGYFFIVSVVVPATVGLVTTVWFGIGTVRDLKRLFHDLENRVRDDADNGFVAK